MPAITMVVAAKSAPQAGRKRWRIQNPSGEVFQVEPTDAPSISEGKTYDITYRDDDWQGRKFRVVESFRESAQQQAAPSPSQFGGADSEKQVDISVLSLMASTKWGEKIDVYDAASLEKCLRMLRAAWVGHKKPPQRQATAPARSMKDMAPEPPPFDDMNDEIPEFR